MTPQRNKEPTGRRPFTARSVVASTLLGLHPPRLSVDALVRSGALFQLPAGTVRVALSRMVAANELTTNDGSYALAGHLLLRQNRQDESRRGVPPGAAWDEQWEMAVIDSVARSAADRAALRDSMRRLRLAELREGLWMRPANLDSHRQNVARGIADTACRWFDAQPMDAPSDLAARLWDLGQWQMVAQALLVELTALFPALRKSDPQVLPAGFTVNAAVLRHLQADPLLPESLLPRSWAGPRLRSRFEEFDAEFNAVWRTWVRSR